MSDKPPKCFTCGAKAQVERNGFHYCYPCALSRAEGIAEFEQKKRRQMHLDMLELAHKYHT